MRNQHGLMLLAAGAVSLWLLSRKKTQDTGDTTGTIKFIRLSQDKMPSAFLGLLVVWTPSTVDFFGKPIPWNYQIRSELFLADTGAPIIADTTEVLTLPSGSDVTTDLSSASFGPLQVPARDILAYGRAYELQAKVEIQAALSDVDGQPTNEYSVKATGVSNPLLINQDLTARPDVSIVRSIVS